MSAYWPRSNALSLSSSSVSYTHLQHAEKLAPLRSAAVQAACNHEDTRSQNQHEQDGGYQIESHHIRIAAESGQSQKGGILGQIFCRKAVGLLQLCDDLAGIGIFGDVYKRQVPLK